MTLDISGITRALMIGSMFASFAWGAAAPTAAEKGLTEIPLWADGAPGALGAEEKDVPRLILAPAAADKANGAAVVVCPGGGYGGLAMDHEGFQIAEWLNGHGISAFIAIYRHAPGYQHPIPSMDAMRAIRTVRARAEEWKVDPKRIGIWGFSAGGHLSATVGVMHAAGDPSAEDPIDRVSARPDFMILCYPVISMMDPEAHAGSRKNLLGENPDPVLVERLSLQLQVDKETPPAFLMHTTQDTGVSPRNSLMFYDALLKAGVPAELHIFLEGPHGVGLANKEPLLPVSRWPELLAEWFRAQGVVPK